MTRQGLALFAFILVTGSLKAQTPNQAMPYSFEDAQQFNREAYRTDTRVHTSLRPFFTDDSIWAKALRQRFPETGRVQQRSAVHRKLFNEHLVEVNQPGYSAYLDALPDFSAGKELEAKKDTWASSFRIQAGGSVGRKFSFFTSLYSGRARFADYYTRYIDSTRVIPGQSFDRTFGRNATKNWTAVTTFVSYTPAHFLNITAGQGKTFIGDGYRSMILSDVSANYPYLKLTAALGRVQYTALWASMKDPGAVQLSYNSGYRKKGAVFHYLDWNVTNRLSLGFFDALVWSQYDDLGIKRGFDWSYANPLIFFRSVEEMNGSPDNVLTAFTGKFEAAKQLTLYGQFVLDEFSAKQFFKKDGYWANKFAVQAGVLAHDLFGRPHLDLRAEFNTARPFTFAERTRIISYSNYDEPLAHPFGANFKETLGIITYQHRRWEFYTQANFANYGLDSNAVSLGKDIFKPYSLRATNFGHSTGQGISTDFRYFEGRLAFLVNPKTNLKFRLGMLYRREQNALAEQRARWMTFGLSSSLGTSYKDF